MTVAGDASQSEGFQDAMNRIIERFGRLDILILNAGLSSYGPLATTTDRALEQVMEVNTFGPYRGARIALPHILSSGGSIVFISSLAGLFGIPYSSVYSMSKMSLTALAQSLKTELTGKGVHIGIIYAGFTSNDQNKTAIAPDGTVKPLQDRPAWIQQSKRKVAGKILNNIRYRRFRSVLSSPGKVMAFFTRYFPRLFQFSTRWFLKTAKKMTAE